MDNFLCRMEEVASASNSKLVFWVLLRLGSGLNTFRLNPFKSNIRVWDFHIFLTLFLGKNFVFPNDYLCMYNQTTLIGFTLHRLSDMIFLTCRCLSSRFDKIPINDDNLLYDMSGLFIILKFNLNLF
jgi:hypothetical protein